MTEDPILNAPIRSLQQMLRTIAFAGMDIPLVIPDGIFGNATKDAVSSFQRQKGLPITGTVDEATHRAIVKAHNEANELLSPAQPAVYRFPTTLVVLPGQHHPHVHLAQSMLQNLHQELSGIPRPNVTGYMDEVTQDGLRLIQALAGISTTGYLDKATWNWLSRLYRSVFDRNHPPSQG